MPWTVDAALLAQGQAPDSAPAGANDFGCEPTKRHPQPVVLAHGLLANQTVNFATLSPYLKNRGFCVFSLTYGTKDDVSTPLYQPGGLRKMQSSARELKQFVKRVKACDRRPQGRHRRPLRGQPDAELVRPLPRTAPARSTTTSRSRRSGAAPTRPGSRR